MAEHHTPFALAAQCFPPTLRNLLHALPVTQQATAEELRLRAGSGLRVVDETGREQLVPDTQWVTQRELQDVIEIATHASFHNAMEPLCRGYLPLPGGNRLGVAGSALSQGGRIRQFRSLSSLAIRIAHDIPGVAEPVAKLLNEQGLTQASCLILAPPGMGKTTLLRDLIRIYSDQWHLRVGVADERGEIAALLRETYGSKIKVFGTEIPHSVRAKEISAEGKSIFAHDPNGKVAEGYKNLTQEVIKLEKQREKSRAGSIR